MDSMTIRERPPESEPYPSGTEPVETPVGYTDAQESNLRIVTNSLHRLNEAITEAVLARFHGGTGNWGDQIYLEINKEN